MSLNIVILAAGKGKRMRSEMPKVLHKIAGQPLLAHVVKTARNLKHKQVYVVYGNGGDRVPKQMDYLNVEWIEQKELLGTGHAVLQVLPKLNDSDQVLVLVGDCPLISKATLQKLIDKVGPNGVGLVTTRIEDPTGFGRILHDQTGKVLGIVEHRDASIQQRKIKEINSGIIMAPAKKLRQWLPNLKNKNAQGEYYLTDIIELAVKEGIHVHSVLARSSAEALGINDRIQLANLERLCQAKIAEDLMLAGATIVDPKRIDIRGNVEVQPDVTIDINVIIEGKTSIGKNSYIGPNCVIKNASIGNNVFIEANTVIEDAMIKDGCTVGPFARIRPGSILERKAKVGNFVEMKKTTLGENSKANHLSYLGDAIIGKDVNVGAGTITCNYDGVNKFQTIIEDGAFIGSDTQLVAPVKVGKNATIGAGSTITRDAPADQLSLSRVKQVNLPDWKRPTKKKQKTDKV